MITLHLYEPKAEPTYAVLTLSGTALCGTVVGRTAGVIRVDSFVNPMRDVSNRGTALYEAQLTKHGLNKVQEMYGREIYIFSRWKGFYGADMPEGKFHLCKKCTQNPDFALLVLGQM